MSSRIKTLAFCSSVWLTAGARGYSLLWAINSDVVCANSTSLQVSLNAPSDPPSLDGFCCCSNGRHDNCIILLVCSDTPLAASPFDLCEVAASAD